jgi:hypothetical protein
MRKASITLFLIASIISNASNGETAEKPIEECRELDAVFYSAPTAVPLKERLIISRTKSELPQKAPGEMERTEKSSPQGTARVIFIDQPDFMKTGPWNTKLAIVGNEAHPIDLTIDFRDHGNGGVTVHWLNEKLLFIRVWWGRIVSTDLVLDVDSGNPIYSEEASYADLILTCDEKRKLLQLRKPK